jgi:hypothetical protein
MTTLTILQTFKLLEEIQVPATFNKIVEVSGQDATDVALNLKLNMEHLDVDDRTSGAGTIYKLKYAESYAKELKRLGKLIEYETTLNPYYDSAVNLHDQYHHELVIYNADKWANFGFNMQQFENSWIAEHQTAPDNTGFSYYYFDVDPVTNIGRSHLGYARSPSPFDASNRWLAERLIHFNTAIGAMEQVGFVFKPNVKMPEEWWTDLPGSLY